MNMTVGKCLPSRPRPAGASGKRRSRDAFQNRLLGGAALLCCAGAVLFGFGSSAAAKSTKPVLTIGVANLGAVSNTLAPTASCCSQFSYNELAYEPLIVTNPNGTLSPGLAASWHYIGRSATRFEFTLRHDARFSDGTLVTARAVKTSLAYFLKTATGNNKDIPITLKSVKTIGRWTVELTLTKPSPLVPDALSDNVQYYGDIIGPKGVTHPASLADGTDGAGAYVLDAAESLPGSKYTFVPNKYYYAPSGVKFREVVLRIIPNSTARLDALETGQIDMDVDLTDATTLSTALSHHLNVSKAPGSYFVVGFPDVSGKIVPALGNTLVRQAMNYAVDRTALVKALFPGDGTPTSEVPTSDGTEAKYEHYYSYDPAKARQLLAQAGYPSGFSMTMGLGSTTVTPAAEDAADAVAQYLDNVGIKVTVDTTSPLPTVWSTESGWSCTTCGVTPTAAEYTSWLSPGGVVDAHNVPIPALTRLYNQAATSRNAGPLWDKLMGLTVTQAYELPIAELDELNYYNSSITDVVSGVGRIGEVNPNNIKPAKK